MSNNNNDDTDDQKKNNDDSIRELNVHTEEKTCTSKSPSSEAEDEPYYRTKPYTCHFMVFGG